MCALSSDKLSGRCICACFFVSGKTKDGILWDLSNYFFWLLDYQYKIQDQSRSRRRRYTYPHRRKDPARALRDTLKFGIRNSECGIIVSGFAGGFRLYTYLGRTPQNSQGCNNAALAQLVEKVITAVNCKKQWGKTLTFLRQTSFVSPTHTPLAPLNRLTARQRAEW